MALYAFSDIKASGKDGKPVTFVAGDEVKGLEKAVLTELIAAGAISQYNRLEVEKDTVDLDSEDTDEEEEEASSDLSAAPK